MGRVTLRVFILLALGLALPPLGGEFIGWGPDRTALPPRGRTIEIPEGRRLHVIEQGSGKPVVLIHGWFATAADWAHLPERLAALDHRVVVYDRVGYGYSSREKPADANYTYASGAADLRALLEKLDIERPTLVGWGYGGAIAQTLALEAPERVSSLVLIGAVGPVQRSATGVGDRPLLHSRVAGPLLRWASSVPPLRERMIQDLLLQRFVRERNVPAGWDAYVEASLSLPGTLDAALAEARRSAPADLSPGRVSVPTLVLHGADDYVVPYAVGEALHDLLPSSKLETVIDGSHMLPVTHADLVAEQIHALAGSRYREGGLEDGAAGAAEPESASSFSTDSASSG